MPKMRGRSGWVQDGDILKSLLIALSRVIKELKSRFQHFKETGDDSKIPADLQRTIYSVVCSFIYLFLVRLCNWMTIGCQAW